jgi:hypothetical protein
LNEENDVCMSCLAFAIVVCGRWWNLWRKEVIKDDMKKNEEEKNEKSLNIIFIPKFFILLDR